MKKRNLIPGSPSTTARGEPGRRPDGGGGNTADARSGGGASPAFFRRDPYYGRILKDLEDGDAGSFTFHRSQPAGSRHGRVRLRGFLSLPDRAFALLTATHPDDLRRATDLSSREPSIDDASARDASARGSSASGSSTRGSSTRDPSTPEREGVAFIDTETTGLSGGAGTHAFLVGVGYFRGGDLHLRQYFLADPGAEGHLLRELGEFLSGFGLLMTFNGKCFDIPVLKDRFVFAGERAPFSGCAHIDLLHPARRIWRHGLDSCNLGTLEARVLGFERSHDLPGELMPELYFDYLRHGDPGLIIPAFHHNRLDILSLVALSTRIGRLLTDRDRPDCPSVWVGLGRLWDRLHRRERAIHCYREALTREGELPAPLRSRVRRDLSLICKRTGRLEEAVTLWEEMISGPRLPSLFPFIELAKYYEHRERDYLRAREVSRRALHQLRLRSSCGGREYEREREELLHRLERLDRKQKKSARERG